MPIVNVTLPSDGTGADVGDYNPAILAILAVLNGHIASDNIEPGSLDWSVMSGTMTNVIPSTAMQDSGSMEKWRDEANIGFTASGLVWSALTGLNATMTAGIQYTPDGLRRSISAVTSRAFTASKDTYISISPAGGLSYQEVANDAAQPALGTDYRWLAKVVTSASAITSVTDMRQTAVIGSQNIDFTTVFLGIARLTATRNFTTLGYVTDMGVSVTIPPGVTKVRVSVHVYATTVSSGGYGELYIYKGATVGTLTTKILSHQIANTSAAPGQQLVAIDDVTAGQTVAYSLAAMCTSGTGGFYSDGITPNSSYILVEACR